MNYERADQFSNLQDLFDECKRLMDYHIIIILQDGTSLDGIIEKVDSNGIIMLVGEDVMDMEGGTQMGTQMGGQMSGQMSEQRQFGNPGRFRRNKRFRRRGFPFGAIRGVFPFVYPFFPFNPFFPF